MLKKTELNQQSFKKEIEEMKEKDSNEISLLRKEMKEMKSVLNNLMNEIRNIKEKDKAIASLKNELNEIKKRGIFEIILIIKPISNFYLF